MGEATPPVVELSQPSNPTTSTAPSVEGRYIPLCGVLAVPLCIAPYMALSIVHAMASDAMSAIASNQVDTDTPALHDARVIPESTHGTRTVDDHIMSIL